MSPSDAQLRRLLAEVLRTKARLRQELQGRAGSPELSHAREAALEALESYAAALERRSWPVPPRMHHDLCLLRGLCGQPGPTRAVRRA